MLNGSSICTSKSIAVENSIQNLYIKYLNIGINTLIFYVNVLWKGLEIAETVAQNSSQNSTKKSPTIHGVGNSYKMSEVLGYAKSPNHINGC